MRFSVGDTVLWYDQLGEHERYYTIDTDFPFHHQDNRYQQVRYRQQLWRLATITEILADRADSWRYRLSAGDLDSVLAPDNDESICALTAENAVKRGADTTALDTIFGGEQLSADEGVPWLRAAVAQGHAHVVTWLIDTVPLPLEMVGAEMVQLAVESIGPETLPSVLDVLVVDMPPTKTETPDPSIPGEPAPMTTPCWGTNTVSALLSVVPSVEHVACQHGNVEIVKWLLTKHFTSARRDHHRAPAPAPTATPPLSKHHPKYHESLPRLCRMPRDGMQRTPLHSLVHWGTWLPFMIDALGPDLTSSIRGFVHNIQAATQSCINTLAWYTWTVGKSVKNTCHERFEREYGQDVQLFPGFEHYVRSHCLCVVTMEDLVATDDSGYTAALLAKRCGDPRIIELFRLLKKRCLTDDIFHRLEWLAYNDYTPRQWQVDVDCIRRFGILADTDPNVVKRVLYANARDPRACVVKMLLQSPQTTFNARTISSIRPHAEDVGLVFDMRFDENDKQLLATLRRGLDIMQVAAASQLVFGHLHSQVWRWSKVPSAKQVVITDDWKPADDFYETLVDTVDKQAELRESRKTMYDIPEYQIAGYSKSEFVLLNNKGSLAFEKYSTIGDEKTAKRLQLLQSLLTGVVDEQGHSIGGLPPSPWFCVKYCDFPVFKFFWEHRQGVDQAITQVLAKGDIHFNHQTEHSIFGTVRAFISRKSDRKVHPLAVFRMAVAADRRALLRAAKHSNGEIQYDSDPEDPTDGPYNVVGSNEAGRLCMMKWLVSSKQISQKAVANDAQQPELCIPRYGLVIGNLNQARESVLHLAVREDQFLIAVSCVRYIDGEVYTFLKINNRHAIIANFTSYNYVLWIL
jgi:hypothetical protein